MSKITPCLWFDTEAEEAMNFYVSVFRNAKAGAVSHYGDHGPMPAGTVMTASFELDGMPFVALNAGPAFKFNEAISLMVNCADQDEIDYYWEKLSEGGATSHCGWLKDRYGVSWQIVPAILPKLVTAATPEQAGRVMAAVMQMTKLDIAAMEMAWRG